LITGDSPAHPSSVAADDEDSLAFVEKCAKGLAATGIESYDDFTAVVCPR